MSVRQSSLRASSPIWASEARRAVPRLLGCLSRVYFLRYPQMENLLPGYRQRNSDPSVLKVVPPREGGGGEGIRTEQGSEALKKLTL